MIFFGMSIIFLLLRCRNGGGGDRGQEVEEEEVANVWRILFIMCSAHIFTIPETFPSALFSCSRSIIYYAISFAALAQSRGRYLDFSRI